MPEIYCDGCDDQPYTDTRVALDLRYLDRSGNALWSGVLEKECRRITYLLDVGFVERDTQVVRRYATGQKAADHPSIGVTITDNGRRFWHETLAP